MEDENINKQEAKPNVESASDDDAPKILNDTLESTVAEPLPSTSKKSSDTQLSDVKGKSCSEDTEPLNPTSNDAPSNRTDCDKKNDGCFELCTVKEMLNEILDCTVIRKPSSSPSTSQANERNLPESNFDAPPEYFLDPRLIPRQIYNIRNDTGDVTGSRKQSTVKEVLSEILDYTVFRRSPSPGCCRITSINDFSRPGPSHRVPDYVPQREYMANFPDYQIFRSMAGIINSSSTIHEESYVQMPITRSLNRILPTYSTVLKLGPAKTKSVHSSPSFIPRIPPPSYAEVDGLWDDGPSLISSESVVFGPDPAYMVCPRCRTVVVTEVERERSNFTHLMALIMCLCLCWPFCILPYCLRSCNHTYHTCPNCRHYFGMYRPF